MTATATTIELPLAGPGGEPVDLWRTIVSHGVADLPPGRVDEEQRMYETTLAIPGARPRAILIADGGDRLARVDVRGPRLGERARARLVGRLRRILNLEEDLSGFYAVAARDPELAWVTRGAGRMLRTPTVFEAVVKTICTTNCAWSATRRMTSALVDHLGEKAAGGVGRAFPTAEAMAAAPLEFYRDVARAGYRGAYLRGFADSVAEGRTDVESLGDAPVSELPDDEVERQLLALPGIGPYAAAHVMMLLGRHSRLILDSWTRPKYARLTGGETVPDADIERRFRRYGEYAGLAFWLYLTRDWVADEDSAEP
ncbi:MAG: Fe-S cluster assembly protein HesB [Actinomycetota bacterium]|nr:Fe-S cluster assembly protein HesB [Actinomycetota bacterium]